MNNSFGKKTAYTLLDWITFGRGVVRNINGMKIRFPARWSRYYEEDYEQANYIFLREIVKPGMHIIDIGAHLGVFSTFCSRLTGPKGKIVCFEPTPGTFSVLNKTLRLNKCSNVSPVEAAVGEQEGVATFYVSNTPGSNSNSLVEHELGGKKDGYKVKVVTIDKIVPIFSLSPQLIKIDAEGAELNVLRGGIETFKKFRPILMVGLHPFAFKDREKMLATIWDILIECGYRMKGEGKSLNKTDFCNLTRLFEVHCFMD